MNTEQRTNSQALIILALFILSAFCLLGCSPANDDTNDKREPIKTTKADKNNAPDFTINTIDGESFTLSDYKGKKAVLVDIWGTWCSPCRKEMPELQKFYEMYPDDVEIIAAAQKSPLKEINEFISENKITFKIAIDTDRAVSKKYKSDFVPFLTVISKEGKILKTFVGVPKNLIGELEKILGLKKEVTGEDVTKEDVTEE